MQSIRFQRSILAILIAGISCQAIAAPQDQGYQADQRNADDPCAKNTSQVAGAVVGALLGAYLGNKVGNGNGRKLATAAGALGGLALGNYVGSELDRRKCEVSRIARKNNLQIVITDVSAQPEQDVNGGARQPGADRVGMSISIEDRPSAVNVSDIAGGDAIGNAASSTQFQSGSDLLSPQANGYFREIAAQYALAFRSDALPQGASQDQFNAVQGLRQKRVLVLGHTDDTGNSRMNADLSEHRARNVASLFADAGMPTSQIYYQGSGETQPVADNRTDAGRARNRRVEIVDLTDEAAFQKYLAGRSTNANFYRVAASPAAVPETATGDAPATLPVATKRNTRLRTADAERAPSRPSPRSGAAQPAAPIAAPTAPLTASAYDFGGQPVGAHPPAIDIGKLVTPKSSFNFISPAMADDLPMARSCGDDRPRVSNPVRGLQGNQEYHVSEYLPNLYGTSWSDRVNGNLVALTNVAVLRDGGAPARKPTVLIYKASPGKSFSNAKPDFSTVADVNTYQGETGLLYRVFVNGPIKCIDVMIPRERSAQAANSNLYYQAGATRMVAAFNPKIAK